MDNEESYLKKQQMFTPSARMSTSVPSTYSSPTHEFSFTISGDIELTPADDIFLHGHLLPLYLPVSPRSSTNSVDTFTLPNKIDTNTTNQNQQKSKSFSIFRIPKWKNKERKLDLGQLIKRYIKMVRPLLSRRSNGDFSHKSYSFSSCKPPEMNKGILIASGSVTPTKTTSESTMEELHAAIQAAIAHCKNSIDMEDKIKSQIN